jgi:hypothetical protein
METKESNRLSLPAQRWSVGHTRFPLACIPAHMRGASPMWLPPVPAKALWFLCYLQGSIVLLEILLHRSALYLATSARQEREVAQNARPPLYWYLVGGVFLIFEVCSVAPVTDTVLQAVALGLMALLTLAPLWGLRELSRSFTFVQGLVVTLGVCVWPDIVSRPYRGWLWLTSVICYTLLFVGLALWRRDV